MIRIEVKSTDTRVIEGQGKNGRPYRMVEQRGWLHGAKDYPTEVSFLLDNGQIPFGPGFYLVGPECVEVDKYGSARLSLNRMKPEARSKAA